MRLRRIIQVMCCILFAGSLLTDVPGNRSRPEAASEPGRMRAPKASGLHAAWARHSRARPCRESDWERLARDLVAGALPPAGWAAGPAGIGRSRPTALPVAAWPDRARPGEWLLGADAWRIGPGYARAAVLTERAAAGAEGLPSCARQPDALFAELLPRLQRVFEAEGVPPQWVWLAEVESAFDPRARSYAGAAGLFQLMPLTAQRFGLRVAPVDDRFEPEKSAAAAARYLKILHRQFGCWTLALAAYNAGEGRVRGLMTRHGAGRFEDLAPFLPAETRAYVPRVMLTAALREDRRLGVAGAYW